MTRFIFNLIFFGLIFTVIGQQCETDIDLTYWSMKGSPRGDWQVVNSNHVIGSNDGISSSYYISNTSFINVKISGTISVENHNDRDFVGLVFGYKKPTNIAENSDYNFFLLDWKGETEGVSGYIAHSGLRLSHYNGFITRTGHQEYMWGTKNNPPTRNLLANLYDDTLGWKPYQEYFIEVIYTSKYFSVSIDSNMIFTKEGCFEPGGFGYYCMSQMQVHFKDFKYQSFVDFMPSSSSVCIDEDITFSLFDPACSDIPPFVESLIWDFGDNSFSTALSPIHSYGYADKFDVMLVVNKTHQCIDTIIKEITVNPFPHLNLGPDMELAQCTKVTLQSMANGNSVLWSTGETTDVIELVNIPNDTILWVEAVNKGCKSSDTLRIKVIPQQEKLFFPNAFTPNGDGINDVFAPVGQLDNAAQYHLMIYDRWGQLIYESVDPHIGWNGNSTGSGVYIYKVIYEMTDCAGNDKSYTKLSAFTLID